MARLVLFERLNWPWLLSALAYRAWGWNVRYQRLTPGLRPAQGWLDGLGIRVIDFSECREPDYGAWMYDTRGLIRAALTQALGPAESLPDLEPFFPGVTDLRKKLWMMLAQPAELELYLAMNLVTWVESLALPPERVIVYVPPTPFRTSYLASSRVAVENRYPAWLYAVEGLAQGAWRALRGVARRVRPQAIPTRSAAPEGPVAPDPQVVYFPHQGVSFGQLFEKDHFYSADPRSPLYPARILHVEVLDRLVPGQAETLRRDYTQRGLELRLFDSRLRAGEVGRWGLRWAGYCLRHRALWKRPRLLAYLGAALLKFEKYRSLLADLPTTVRLALVGYEIMFPKSLALALESRGIPTVAIQERFMHTYFRETAGFVVDTYLCSSPAARRELGQQWHRSIRQLREIGFVRGDLLDRYRNESVPRYAPQGRQLVVAFDYHSPADANQARSDSLVNWDANRLFLRDLIALAGQHPELHIVIRGKYDDWCELPAFADLREVIERLPNLEVNRDYTSWNVSYRLAAQADLVIAKHTSIADECLAAGKSVLIHDYTHNSRSAVACLFDYPGLPVFVHSWDELEQGVKRFLLTGHTLTEDERQSLRGILGDPGQGQARPRLQAVLEEMLEAG